MLQVSPDVLDRIQLRRVSRQPGSNDLILQRLEVIVYQPASVSRQSVPDNEKLSRNRTLQMMEEDHDVFSLDRFFEHLEVEVPQCQPGDEGKRLPVVMVK